MTLPVFTGRVVAACNGATTVFPFGFLIPDASSLVVTKTNTTTGVVTTLVYNTDYTVSGLANPAGGSVTVLGTPIPSGNNLTIQRLVPYSQSVDLTNQDNFYAEVLESGLDYITMEIQQLSDTVSRALVQDPYGLNTYDAGSRRIINLATPSLSTDAATKGYADGLAVAAGNVPSPGAGNVGKWLQALTSTTWGWASLVVNTADITNLAVTQAKLALKAVGLSQIADFSAAKKLLGSTQAGATAAEVSLGVSLDIASGALNGVLPTVTVRAAGTSGTHTPLASTRRMRVRLIGPGGAGGGAPSTTGTTGSSGSGGGAGGYVEHEYTTVAGSYSYSVGSGGTGVAGSNGNAGSGATTFGALSAGAGGGGFNTAAASGNTAPASGGSQGAASGGNIMNVTGNNGGSSFTVTGQNVLMGGQGGTHPFGNPGPNNNASTTAGSADGYPATGYGAGGGGAVNGFSQANRAGGAGGPGLIIIEEYTV